MTDDRTMVFEVDSEANHFPQATVLLQHVPNIKVKDKTVIVSKGKAISFV